MISTVISYFPLVEEEVPHSKIELSKKADNENNDNDCDDESELEKGDAVDRREHIDWADLSGTLYLHVNSFRHYVCLPDDDCTPPPRV